MENTVKKCSLFCAGFWPFLIFPLLLLLLFSIFQWRSVEEDVAANAQQKTINLNAQWAVADTFNRGREVQINGAAPSKQAQEQLKQTVLDAKGVNSVVFADGIVATKPLSQPELLVSWQGDKVTLQGEINNQATIDKILMQATDAYGSERIINQLTLSDKTANLDPVDGLFGSLIGIENGAEISIKNNEITLTGEVASQAIKASITNNIRQFFSGNVNNLLSIKSTPIVESTPQIAAPAPVIKKDECESQVANLLSTTKIVFASAKADISDESYELLNNIADIVKRCSQAEFEVAGHTDSNGRLQFNMELSRKRAQAVADYLIEQGLLANRFDVVGYGPNKPIASNDTDEGQAQNRRIEFNLKN